MKIKKKKMKISAGILIIYNNKILLVHSKNSPWKNTYTPPKGNIEEGESESAAAIRETMEEIGIEINPEQLSKNMQSVLYADKKGKVYKTVHLFTLTIKDLKQIGLESEIVPKTQLQVSEIDDARFMDLEEIKMRVLPYYMETILKYLK